MTKTQIEKYFKCRPSCKELYVVNGAVFIDKKVAGEYAKSVKGEVETIRPGDEGTEYTYEEAWEVLKSMELNPKADVNKLAKLVNALELEPKGETLEAYLKVLTDCKTQIEE